MIELVPNMLLGWQTEQLPPLIERVLWVDPAGGQVVTIEIEHRRKKQHRSKHDPLMPVLRDIAEIEAAFASQQVHQVEHDPFAYLLRPDDAFAPDLVQKRNDAYALISPLLEQHSEALFDQEKRGSLIADWCEKTGATRKTLYSALTRYWQRGQTLNALLPLYHLRGKPGGPRRSHGQKLGRPSGKSQATGLTLEGNLTEAWRELLTSGISRFYHQDHLSLRSAWKKTLWTYFTFLTFSPKDGSEDLKLRPAHERPTFRQFYSVYEETRDTKAAIIAREGEQAYNLRHRPPGGKSTQMASGPGELLQFDSTVADVYLVSSFNRRWIIGRPVITVAIDVFSRTIVGFNVSLKGPSWETARLTLENVAADKVAFCRRYGVTITEADWPNCHLPTEVLGDRGELMTTQLRKVIERLGIHIANTPPRRADWKAIVERAFRLCNDHLIHWLPGTTHVTEEELSRRAYEMDAALDLHQFRRALIQLFLFHNLKHFMKWYDLSEFQIADQVQRIPIELWNWGRRNRTGRGRIQPVEVIRRNLLYSGTASISERGIYFEQAYYAFPPGEQKDWWLRAYRRGRDPVAVLYDPRDMTTIYLDHSKNLPPVECHLYDWQQAYQGHDWFELQDLFKRQKLEADWAEEQELHDELKFYGNIAEIVAEGKAQTAAAWAGQGHRTRELSIPQAKQLEQAKEDHETYSPLEEQGSFLQQQPGAAGPAEEGSADEYVPLNQPIDLFQRWVERHTDHDHS